MHYDLESLYRVRLYARRGRNYCSANTYIASVLAITDNKLVPILVEPDLNSYNLDLLN
jgi:hypothetical protein